MSAWAETVRTGRAGLHPSRAGAGPPTLLLAVTLLLALSLPTLLLCWLDANPPADGIIARGDASRALQARSDAFTRADRDRDGLLNAAEAAAAAIGMEAFARMDRNGDFLLTREEFIDAIARPPR